MFETGNKSSQFDLPFEMATIQSCQKDVKTFS